MKNFKEIKSRMKTFKNIILSITIVLGIGCETDDVLIEQSISNQTAGSYFSSAGGFEDLSKSIYPLLKPISQLRALTLNGTDLFSRQTAWDQVGYQLSLIHI